MYNLKRNERGFTLVEILATLVISSIIMVFVGSIIVKAYNTYDSTASENMLRDEADIIMAKLNRDVFPLEASQIKRLYTTCQNDMPGQPEQLCTTGAWLEVEIDDLEHKIGFNNPMILSISGNYEIQNSNIEVASFKICYVSGSGASASTICDAITEEPFPTYVFKLTLRNKTKNMLKQFTNEIPIVY